MQIEIEPGPLQLAFVIAAGLACAVVAFKSFDYVRENLRRRKHQDPDPPAGPGADPDA